MKELIKNKNGATLIETLVAIVIIAIILITVVGALLYGQKMIVFSDTRNNAAAIGQDQIDKKIEAVESGTVPNSETTVVDGHNTVINVTGDTLSGQEVYYISVRVYYNNNNSYIDLSALAKYYDKRKLNEGGDFI